MATSIDAVYGLVAAALMVFLFRAVRQGRFGSVYGDKLSVSRTKEPALFWTQAALIFLTGLFLIWAAVT